MMKVVETPFRDLFIIEPRVFNDNRGYFFESYNKNVLNETGIDYNFVQDNQSKSTYGVVRGLHFQNPPYAQTKLIRVLFGKILDVVVDIRIGSPTYGQVYSEELSSENFKQLLVPQGFAHGFSVLSDEAVIMYKCDNFYNKESEGGLMYNDPDLNIDWKVKSNQAIISEKDMNNSLFKEFKSEFKY